ncbi:MAG: hypothetical protein ACOX1L_06570 [Erysipelotrichaceae bacterium]|jgi:hypothetical protein
MENKLFILLIGIIIIFIILQLTRLRRETTLKLEEILYVNSDVKTYLNVLNNNKLLKLLYPAGTIENLILDGYMMLDDADIIEKQFEKVEALHLNKGELLDFNLKKLSYFAKADNKKKSKQALDAINKILENNNKEKYREIKEEADRIFRLYIDKDVSLENKLLQLANRQKGIQKGITYFRLAKIAYYKKEQKDVEKYLNLAKPLVERTNYQQIVELCEKAPEKLRDY